MPDDRYCVVAGKACGEPAVDLGFRHLGRLAHGTGEPLIEFTAKLQISAIKHPRTLAAHNAIALGLEGLCQGVGCGWT